MEWYQQELLEHYRSPAHRGTLDNPDFTSASLNPSCGDSVSFSGIIKEGILTAVAFQGSGCVISQGAASMLAHRVLGKPLAEIMAIKSDDMLALIGMQLGPNRIRCALLPLEALTQGISSYQEIDSGGSKAAP